jgi:hypothetical protein
MTAGQFYDVGADAVSNSPRPLSSDYLVFGADNVSTRDGGRFGQRARQRPWVSGLGSQVIDRCRHGGFIAVGIEHLSHKVKVDPYRPSLLVRLTQSLGPSVGKFRRNLFQPLVYQAESDLWNHGTQIHQMPSGSPSRDQRGRGTAHRVPHDHHIVVAAPRALHIISA